jgi:hypothetical protein
VESFPTALPQSGQRMRVGVIWRHVWARVGLVVGPPAQICTKIFSPRLPYWPGRRVSKPRVTASSAFFPCDIDALALFRDAFARLACPVWRLTAVEEKNLFIQPPLHQTLTPVSHPIASSGPPCFPRSSCSLRLFSEAWPVRHWYEALPRLISSRTCHMVRWTSSSLYFL